MTVTATELQMLVERAQTLPPMTDDQRRTQCISFAFGNLALDGCAVTRDIVAAEYDRTFGSFDGAGVA